MAGKTRQLEKKKHPDALRTIGEVAEILGIAAHVLRFWESKFPQIKPLKRRGGHRFYRPSDIVLLRGIKEYLHTDGMTIRGVRRMIHQCGVKCLTNRVDQNIYDALEEVRQFANTPPAAGVMRPNKGHILSNGDMDRRGKHNTKRATLSETAKSGTDSRNIPAPQKKTDKETIHKDEAEAAPFRLFSSIINLETNPLSDDEISIPETDSVSTKASANPERAASTTRHFSDNENIDATRPFTHPGKENSGSQQPIEKDNTSKIPLSIRPLALKAAKGNTLQDPELRLRLRKALRALEAAQARLR